MAITTNMIIIIAGTIIFTILVVIIIATIIITIVGTIHKELHWFLGCWCQERLWGDVLEGR